LNELGFETYGVEVGPALAAYARDLIVHVGPFEELPPIWPAAYFDYVVTFHVLEHLVEPVAAVVKIARLLKPGGVWFNYMPNVRAPRNQPPNPKWYHFNPDNPEEHINYFDSDTIRLLAKKAGLEVYAEDAESDDFWIEARPTAS
jgi:SAM-dependent methyltransferase